jgi:hypothetical protein
MMMLLRVYDSICLEVYNDDVLAELYISIAKVYDDVSRVYDDMKLQVYDSVARCILMLAVYDDIGRISQ